MRSCCDALKVVRYVTPKFHLDRRVLTGVTRPSPKYSHVTAPLTTEVQLEHVSVSCGDLGDELLFQVIPLIRLPNLYTFVVWEFLTNTIVEEIAGSEAANKKDALS